MVQNIIQEIDRIAQAQPDFPAFDELGTIHSYGDLYHYSNALAAWLDQQNLPANSPILIYGDHQFEMMASFIGCLKAGHAYIPVETESALPRVKSILTTAAPQMVLAVDDFPADELDFAGTVVNHDQLVDLLHQEVDYQLDHFVDGDDLFYILFTSGTTGSPKGVEITHTNICSFASWMVSDAFNLPHNQTFLGQPPFSFDLSNMYWLPALLTGSTIKALPRTVVQNFGQLFTVVPKLGVSVYVSTPSFVDMLLLSPDFNQEKMPELKYFLFCGEELTVSTAKRLFTNFPDAHIFNTYGPTEAAVAITSVEITKEMVATAKRLPIGYDKPNVTTSIWDDGKEVTEPNVHGEIIIAGESVAPGYMNNPEKTAANFFKLNGVQAYRTGDAGYIDEDGMRHIIGRMDFQIKLHGFRIELDEVRSSLELSQYVKQAVAVPKYAKDGKVSHLIAYIIAKDNDFADDKALTKAIRADLKDQIMDYMMPTQFVYVDSFPTSANGKIAVKQMIAEANE